MHADPSRCRRHRHHKSRARAGVTNVTQGPEQLEGPEVITVRKRLAIFTFTYKVLQVQRKIEQKPHPTATYQLEGTRGFPAQGSLAAAMYHSDITLPLTIKVKLRKHS